MSSELFLPIATAAAGIAALHALAPDHWMPLAALARAQRWSPGKTARIAAGCGFAHVTVSVVLGVIGLAAGVRIFDRFGAQMESFAGIALITFGVLYALWGLRHAAAHVHGHSHHHYDHVHDPQQVTPWMVVLLFAADPCLAIFPLMFAAAPMGWGHVAIVVLLYEVSTIVTIVGLTLPARAAAGSIVRGQWVHRYGHALAGAFIVAVGVSVAVLGW